MCVRIFLRHASFYGLLPDSELLSSFNVELSDLPVLYLVSDKGYSLIPFPGEVIEPSITEWVLRQSTPLTDELSFARPSGELYFTQFFSSKKLKFILFLPTSLETSKSKRVIESWRELSELFRSEALFSYMIGGSVPDVLDFFAIDEKRDFPLLVAHDPSKDYKYVSGSQISLSGAELETFVSDVLAGKIERVLKVILLYLLIFQCNIYLFIYLFIYSFIFIV